MGPVLLTSALQAVSGSINNAYLGRLVGANGLAAAAVIAPVQGMLFLLLMAFAMGAAVLVGRASGSEDADHVTRIGGTSLAVTALLCVVLGISGYLAMPSCERPGAVPWPFHFQDSLVQFLGLVQTGETPQYAFHEPVSDPST